MYDELKKNIFEGILTYKEKNATNGLYYHVMAEELGLNKEQVLSECKYLEDDGCLEKEKMKFPGERVHTVGIRITSKGKTALQTIYNPEWVKQNNKEKEEEKTLRKRGIENIETSLRWTKWGVIGAIVLGAISLIYTIFKP